VVVEESDAEVSENEELAGELDEAPATETVQPESQPNEQLPA
jgi:hypothetical protein